jgi:two-component system cell cycle sensor histidine kinase PleC
MFQFYIGLTWGATIWLLWENGNLANNIFVLMPFVGILWAYSISRAMHLGVYLAAVLPIVLLGSLRVLTAPDVGHHALAFVLPVVFGYTLVLALMAIRQFESLQVVRLANDDMAVDLRRAHDEAIRKRFEAEAANASKTTFLANMSHELRTPLNAILGFSDIIANERLGGVGTPRYKDYAFDINASGAHLLSIINDILDIAKIESGKMELYPVVLDPRNAVDDAVKVVAGRARERRQTLDVAVADDVPMPYADERAMKQIVINLVGNAVKFTQEGGHIEVTGRRADGGFELCVADNGPGIATDLLDKIFTPFNQVDNRYNRNAGGTGLGLSLVRGLAELHGGKAWLESEMGQGTRAYVYFPVANAPDARARPKLSA